MFNSLKYAKKLEEVGLSREQAETHMMIITEIMETNLATKQDIKDLQISTKQDMKNLTQDFKSLEVALENKIIQSEYRMTVKLGTIVSIAIGVAVTIAKLF